MKRYIYCYQTAVSFSEPVTNHSLLLRCLPVVGSYMNVEEEHLVVPPSLHMRRDTDQLGNRIVYGGNREPHASTVYISTGIVSMAEYAVAPDAIPLMVYQQSTPLTALGEEQDSLLWQLTSSADTEEKPSDLPSNDVRMQALDICRRVHAYVAYCPGVTGMDTPATQVVAQRKGVCQDYAHLMIALCRNRGIAARYVCGFMEGEGETHAWVEVFDGYGWTAFDPTHGTPITYGYLKIAHGRDAADCPVSRGIYAGGAMQQTQIHVMLKEI